MENFFTLHNGIKIPVIGFGTWQIPNGEIAYNSVITALKAGYRHIDTAMVYRNETSVGQAIKDSGLKRDEIFLTTKLPANIKGYQEAIDNFNLSLQNLQQDYVDLYLIHNAKPWEVSGDGMEYMDKNIETWKAFEKLYKDGKIRSIGVSNFLPKHLEVLLKNIDIIPMVNQIRVYPNDIPHENIKFCKEHNILVEAYSPLGTGKVFSDERFTEIANKYHKTVAQLLIRWSFQNDLLPLPKSATESRIIENFNIFDFEISKEDMEKIGII